MRRRTFLVAATLVAAPRVAWAQGARLPRVALFQRSLNITDMTETGDPRWAALLGRLREFGYVEGETVTIERWSLAGRPQEDISSIVDLIVGGRPDVIVASGGFQVMAVASATKTILIVGLGTFTEGMNLARPGGNFKGISSQVGVALTAKRLQLLHDLVPSVSHIAVLLPRRTWEDELQGGTLRTAAEQLGVELVPFVLELPIEEAVVRSAIASIAESNAGAIYVVSLNMPPGTIAAIRLPSMGGEPDVRRGLLMAYYAPVSARFGRAAEYVDLVLKGADPAVLPIEQPREFVFLINLKTAETLGITIPPKLMIFATEFIE